MDYFPRFKGNFEQLRTRNITTRERRTGTPPILPNASGELSLFYNKLIEKSAYDVDAYEAGKDLETYTKLLKTEFSEQPEILFINAFCIGSLRRDPTHEPYLSLFKAIWYEHREFMILNLDNRWLLSSLITFEQIGENEAQRTTAALSEVFFNMFRLYETERLLTGQPNDEPRYFQKKAKHLTMPMQFTRYSMLKGDTDVNTLKLLLRWGEKDPVTGDILNVLLNRMNFDPHTIFSRIAYFRWRRRQDDP